MKRIIILQSNKDDIMCQIKRLGLEIEQKASSYIILKQNDILKESIQFIFKSINVNRPADFYKYKKDYICNIVKLFVQENITENRISKYIFERVIV